MRMKAVSSLVPGELLAQPVFGKSGQILLQKHVELTSSYIKKLENYGHTYVFIEDPRTEDIEVSDALSQELQAEVLNKIERTFKKIQKSFEDPTYTRDIRLGDTFQELFGLLFDHVLKNQVVLTHLTSLYTSDNFLYSHCMNVSLYAGAIAVGNGYSESRVKELGVGAMLHDIGKLAIDKSILDKPGRLTDEERTLVEQHCQIGYDLLIQQPSIHSLSAHCALQHHERMNGKGYPRRLKGMEIHEFGRIMAVADVYDALTSNRVYRKAFLPHEAVEMLYAGSGVDFDPEFIRLFVKHVNVYPPGVPVVLNGIFEGVVVRNNPQNLLRPVVRILRESGRDVEPYDIDLSVCLHMVISNVIQSTVS
ncbi:HD-GYP domain-containing protein [Alicyclobacillus tolerans]|uniref:HD-GYP domain-containing protein n=1 Tax=Alicyclobacillus tolerans TaxID=90970 RepID=UPI003B7E023A